MAYFKFLPLGTDEIYNKIQSAQLASGQYTNPGLPEVCRYCGCCGGRTYQSLLEGGDRCLVYRMICISKYLPWPLGKKAAGLA
jgi:hypothetical protein